MVKTRSMENLEEKMKDLDTNSLRYHVLESAKKFKTSWVDLARSLYSVYKDKLYKDWGFSTIEAYTAREIGIRKQTAMKLMRSYYFLEKEEPECLLEEDAQSQGALSVPSYESVDVLRLAKNKKGLDSADYEHLKKEVFEKGKDHREVKKDLTAMIRQREELAPEEAYQKRRLTTIRRFLGTLKAIKEEAEVNKLLSAALIKEAASLIKKLELEIS